MADDIVANDAAALPGPAQSWAPGEPPVGNADTKAVTDKMADNTREKIAQTDKIYGQLESATDRILPRIEQLSKDAGVEAQKLKPWNADEEAAKRRTDPITAFGSFGSVFGIVASAFTHAPMENALNASAAAMNAIKANDDKSYDRAAKAWQDNWKMAMDRHKIQQDAYQDAVSLLNVNMTAANTKLQVAAARFGDKQMLTLLEAGMSKEVQDLLASRQKMGLELAQQYPKVVEANAEMSRLFALGYDTKQPTSEKSQQALQKFKQEQADWKQAERAFTPEQQAMIQFKKEKPNATAEETADYVQALRTRKKDLTPEQEAVNTFLEQKPDATAEELKAFVVDLRAKSRGGAAGGNTMLTGDRQRAADVAKYREELGAEKNEDGSAKYTSQQIADMAAKRESQLKTSAAAPSGNKVDAMRSIYDRAGMMTETIDKVDGLLAKHKALTGLGGTVTRPGEVVTNWFGSNETDRAQFRRYVSELQEWGTRVLNESSGRPLSAEVTKLSNILPGLSPGDTTANVVRAYRELKPLIGTIREQLKKRMEGNWTPESGPGGTPAPATGKNAPWLRDPVVPGKRSEIGSDSEVA